jgi:hypothetical protein
MKNGKSIDAKKAVQELISYTVVTDKGKLERLLMRHGVKLGKATSDRDVTTAVLIANRKSNAFKNELAKVLQDKLPEAGEKFSNIVGSSQDFGFTGVDDVTYMKGFTGVDDFSDFTGWDDFKSVSGVNITPSFAQNLSQATSTAVAAKKPQTKVGAAISSIWQFTKTNILTQDNINAGIQAGLNKVNSDSAARQNGAEQQAYLLQQQQMQMQSKVKSGASSNTILYVGIGAVALIGIIFLVVKSKK